MSKTKLGLIGAGRIGSLHAKNLAFHIQDAELVAVSDVQVEAAKKCGKENNIPKVYKDYQAILNDKDIKAVLICSPTDTHAKIIKESAQAGKHIFCEKPIALELKEIDQALEAAGKSQVKLQVGLSRRFDPSFKRIQELVAKGKIGEPHILKITSRDPEPPPLEYIKSSGGLFIDMTIHDFDMARFLMGEEVEEIYSSGSVLIDPKIGEVGDIDTAATMLRFENGALGVIDNSRKATYGYDQRVEVFGSEGKVSVSNKRKTEAELSDSDISMVPDEVEEAAMLDGCSKIGAFLRIVIPLTYTGLLAVGAFVFIMTWNNYLYAFAFISSPIKKVLPQAILGFIGEWGTNWGGLTAAGNLAVLPPVILFLLFQQWFIKGMTGGAVE